MGIPGFKCDSGLLERFLESPKPADLPAGLEEHLAECENCRKELEKRAADPELWEEAADLLGDLGTGESIAAGSQLFFEGAEDGERQKVQPLVQSFLDSLSPSDDPERLGRLGEYEISGVIGIGGMGAVLKGFDQSLSRVVAIKVMAPHLANNGSARIRFQREARAAAAITHDNVMDIYRVAETNGLPYIVMPFARGQSLQKRIDEGGPLSTIEVLRIGRQIASGLAAAHEQGLVHRDIKPANILLNDGIERLVITDFGVARAMDDASMTQTGLIAGTPQYMSPEQARGESVDNRSDLFSLGAVLYTSCTGRPPFRADAAYGILRRITDTDPRPIQEINSDIPWWLSRLIERLMAKHPADRFQDAHEVAEIFEKCLAHTQQPGKANLPASLSDSRDAAPQLNKQKQMVTSGDGNRRVPRGIALGLFGGLLLLAAVMLGYQLTSPPKIDGQWKGEDWASIDLNSVEEADHWYAGKIKDQEGNIGALHLEWSRIQRRFNGRWSMNNESGSITLRSGSRETLRGAIMSDSNKDVSRLRDFVWSPSVGKKTPDTSVTEARSKRSTEKTVSKSGSVVGAPFDKSGSKKYSVISSPVTGQISFIHEALRGGAAVSQLRKGTVLLEIRPQEIEKREQWESQLKSLEESMAASQAKAAAYKNQAKGFEEANEYALEAASAKVEACKVKIQFKQAELQKRQAAIDQEEADFARQKQLFEKKLISDRELAAAKRQIDIVKADMEVARNEIRGLENELRSEEAVIGEKQKLGQTKVDYAQAMYQDSLASVAKIKGEISELQIKMTQMEKIRIAAPYDARIESVSNLEKGDVCKEGKALFRLQKTTQQSPYESTSLSSTSSDTFNNRLQESVSSFDSISRIGKELMQFVAKKADAESEMASIQKEIDLCQKQIVDLTAKIKKASPDSSKQKKGGEDPGQAKDLQVRLIAVKSQLAGRRTKLESVKRQLSIVERQMAVTSRELETMRSLLESELRSAVENLNLQMKQKDAAKIQFEMGEQTIDKLTRQEQLAKDAEARVSKLQILLNFCREYKVD